VRRPAMDGGRERFLDPPANHLGDYLWNGGFAGRPGALVLAIANDSDPVANREHFLKAVRDVDDGKVHDRADRAGFRRAARIS